MEQELEFARGEGVGGSIAIKHGGEVVGEIVQGTLFAGCFAHYRGQYERKDTPCYARLWAIARHKEWLAAQAA